MKDSAEGRTMVKASEVDAILGELKPRLLEGLDSDVVASMVKASKVRRFPTGSVITNEKYPANHLFLVIRGRMRYFCLTPRGEKIVLYWGPPGEVFGTGAMLLEPTEYIVSAEAVQNTTMLVWDRVTIRSFAQQYPRLIENGLMLAWHYLVLYRALHMSLSCNSASQRLAQILGNLANGMGRRVNEGIELDVRNEELANEAHLTVFTVSRLLSEWQRRGLVVKGRGKVVLRSPEELMLMEG